MKSNHEIDFEIIGAEMQCVEIELDPQETVIAEPGAFMYMDGGIEMTTIFGDGSKQNNSILDKLFGAGKRLLTGESMFMTAYTHTSFGKARVAFASPYPGKIIPLDLSQYGGKIICQKMLFYVLRKGLRLELNFNVN